MTNRTSRAANLGTAVLRDKKRVTNLDVCASGVLGIRAYVWADTPVY